MLIYHMEIDGYQQRVWFPSLIKKCINCYVDTDLSSEYAQADAKNAENIISRMGYVITYAGCPVLWCSKLQI